MATYFKGQVLQLYDSYYLVHDIAPNGYPNAVSNCDKFGERKHPHLEPILSSNPENGFKGIDWVDVTPIKLSEADAKYAKVIHKIREMEKRFAQRNTKTKDNPYAYPS